MKAHRYSYEIHRGPIPEGMVVCHTCDNGLCVNPDHLWVGTQAENIRDMFNKGRDKQYRGPRPWAAKYGDENISRKYPETRPRGERVNTAKLNAEKVRRLRAMASNGVSQSCLAKQFGISQASVSFVVLRKSWKHITD